MPDLDSGLFVSPRPCALFQPLVSLSWYKHIRNRDTYVSNTVFMLTENGYTVIMSVSEKFEKIFFFFKMNLK